MGYFTQKLISLQLTGFLAEGVLRRRLRLLPQRSVGVGVAAILVIGASLPVLAEPDDWLDNPQRAAIDAPSSSFVAQPSVSAAQAAAYVRRLHGGRVLSVSPSRRGDDLGYRVRVLVAGGRVKTVYVNSGQANRAAPSNPAVRSVGDN